MLLKNFIFLRKGNSIIVADIIESFASNDFRLYCTSELGENISTRFEITIECTVADISQFGKL